MGLRGGEQRLQFQTLAQQSSLHGLKLDEVQNQLGHVGKPLGSMNFDELLKNAWSGEASQAMGMDIENVATPAGQYSSGFGLQCQGSVTLARTLSKRTVDDVWREIQLGKMKTIEERRAQERQSTLAEMTLEDFLMKAGVVPETPEKKVRVEEDLQSLEGNCNAGSVGGVNPMAVANNFPQQAQWMQYQHQQQNMINAYMPGVAVTQPLSVSASPLLDIGYSENEMAMPSPLMGTLSDTQTPGWKRVAPGDVVEKSIERRHKRMIKNRESAARSRARKQAYTNELENKVSLLEEENGRLKKQKDLEMILHCSPHPEPKYQLRRTSSAPL